MNPTNNKIYKPSKYLHYVNCESGYEQNPILFSLQENNYIVPLDCDESLSLNKVYLNCVDS